VFWRSQQLAANGNAGGFFSLPSERHNRNVLRWLILWGRKQTVLLYVVLHRALKTRVGTTDSLGGQQRDRRSTNGKVMERANNKLHERGTRIDINKRKRSL
jgi:hypothetical protein